MAIESPYAGQYFCEKCKKTKAEKHFYGSNNLLKYPTGKLKQCKDCITMHVDNWNPDTYTWILEECDVPYVPSEWALVMQKYAKDASKLTGATILGRYLAKMHLKQWRDYRWADTEFLQKMSDSMIEATMKQAGGYTASDITAAIQDSQKIELPQKPEIEPYEPSENFYNQFSVGECGEANADAANKNLLTYDLSEEDRIILQLKWGKSYHPEEWVQLEKLYKEMMESYDIQTAAHIDTLKFICKTSLKANQLIDLGD